MTATVEEQGVKLEAGIYYISGSISIVADHRDDPYDESGTYRFMRGAYIRDYDGNQLCGAMDHGFDDSDAGSGGFGGPLAISGKIIKLTSSEIIYLCGRTNYTTGEIDCGNIHTFINIIKLG